MRSRARQALSSYAGGNDDHHLGASPLWPAVKRRFRDDFTPSAENSYDLTRPTERGQGMLAELLVYLRMEVPEGDWSMHPLQTGTAAGTALRSLGVCRFDLPAAGRWNHLVGLGGQRGQRTSWPAAVR